MTADPARELVRRTVTGHVVTAVFETASGVLWLRAPGPRRTSTFHAVPPNAATALSTLSGRDLNVVRGEPAGRGLLYRVPSSHVAVDLISAVPTAEQWERITDILTAVGRGLRELHDLRPGDVDTRPQGAARLAAWLRGGPQSSASARLGQAWRARIGARRTAQVLDWCDEVGAAGPHDVLLHGGTSLGVLVDGAGGPPSLLCGEEIASGRPEYDVGWLCGELLEWQLVCSSSGDAAASCTAARQALLRSYGNGIDLDVIDLVMILRIATHAHDFAAYVGWIDPLSMYLDIIADLADQRG